MFQQLFSLSKSVQTLPGIAFRAARKSGKTLPAPSECAGKPFQLGSSPKGSPERCCFRFFFVSYSFFFRFFRFLPFLSVSFLPFFGSFWGSDFFRFVRSFFFEKKGGRHRSQDPFCETPTPAGNFGQPQPSRIF